LGYSRKGVPSPYVWAKTNQYRAGKYVADGVYDPNHVDTQNGCAALLVRMAAQDPSIKFTSGQTPVKPANHVTTAVVAGAGSGAVVAASTGHMHAFLIVGAVLLISIVIGLIMHFYNEGKTNVAVKSVDGPQVRVG
jgi:hypothetical protein